MYSDITVYTSKFYLTGESYAGKYLPLFTYELLEYNKKNDKKLPLLATIIIDPYSTPILQRTNMHVIPRALEMIDDNNLFQISALE